jgi:hypothetical protein
MKKLITLLAISCFGFYSMAQINIVTTEMTTDGKSLIEAYISPLGYSLGAALNNGWYNTAKPHQLGGFDFTITANLVLVPADAKTFNISESNGSTFSGTGDGNTPTILGSGDNVGEATYDGNKFDMPAGLNIPMLPVPMLQAGVGLIKNTEIDVRFMPEIEMSGVSTGLWGVGVKHDILQWLPIADKIPIDVSFQAGYTKLSSQVMLKYSSGPIEKDAEVALDVRATTFNILLSKKIAMFTAYAGLGYNSTKTTFNVETDDNSYTIAGLPINVNDLTKFEFESNNNLRANIGFRFQIAVLALQANYTFSEYPVATVGLGISIR